MLELNNRYNYLLDLLKKNTYVISIIDTDPEIVFNLISDNVSIMRVKKSV